MGSDSASDRRLRRKLGELRQIREQLVGLLEEGGTPEQLQQVVARLRGESAEDRGLLGGLGEVLQALVDVGRHRMSGEYETDEFGFDPEYLEAIRPIFHFMYRHYFRATSEGVERIPAEGPVLLVANHAGIIFWDGAMVMSAIDLEHPRPRPLRAVFLSWFARLPFIAPLLARFGHVQAMPENTLELLKRGKLVAVFPEGMKGAGKLFRDRYRLKRFGRGGFIKVAVEAGAKLVPVSVVGAEEVYPMFYRLGGPTGRILGLPFIPFTPTFPWLGPLGLIPLPARFRIRFHEPIDSGAVSPEKAHDFTFIDAETQKVREIIQASLDELRVERGHPYLDKKRED